LWFIPSKINKNGSRAKIYLHTHILANGRPDFVPLPLFAQWQNRILLKCNQFHLHRADRKCVGHCQPTLSENKDYKKN
jgi:hypothetical protein